LATDFDHVGEALGGYQGGAGAFAFEERVGGDRGAVQESVGIAPAYFQSTCDDAFTLVRGARHLARRDLLAVPQDQVGEGTPNVDSEDAFGHYDPPGGDPEALMSVMIESTPNPNALKFTVGVDVGGPKTFVAGQDTDDPMASALLALNGVTSIFMTADFVTLSKTPEADWGPIATEAQGIVTEYFG